MATLFDRFDAGARRVVVLAQEEARMLNHNYIGSEHILLGLTHEGAGVATKALEDLGISLAAVRREVEEIIGLGQQPAPKNPLPFTPRAKNVLEFSLDEAQHDGRNDISPEHLLLGLTRAGEGVAAQVLMRLGTHLDIARQQVRRVLAERRQREFDEPAKAEQAWPLLDQCGRDLTAAARQSRLDPVVGRTKEIERVVQILTRRNRNVPLLVGEPGVGKTAVAFGFAQSVAAGDVPPALQHRTVRSLDLGTLLADPQHRGRGIDLVTALLSEVRSHRSLVVYLSGALSPLHLPDGTTNPLSLFRSLLGTPGVLVLGSCTRVELEQRGLEPAVDRLIQPVPVDEPAPEDLLEILRVCRNRLEEHHQVAIRDEALEAAASLASHHVPDQHLPGSAIDLLDEASAQVRVSEIRTFEARLQETLQRYDAEIAEARRGKEAAIEEQDYERAASMRHREVQLIAERRKAKQNADKPTRDVPLEIGKADVENALAVYSGTQSPEPTRTTTVTRRTSPVEHDPYVWSMS